jgi:hypothetical protein
MNRPVSLLLLLAVFPGCALVAPIRPVAEPTPDPRCTLELLERRRRELVAAAEANAPLLQVTVSPGPVHDRTVRRGKPVTVVPSGDAGALVDDQRQTLSFEPGAGIRWLSDELRDGAVVRITPIASDRAAPVDPRAEFAVHKADSPTANRPRTCDGTIREGDFVYLTPAPAGALAEAHQGQP